MEKIAFCEITFDPIKIETHSAPQNDRLNFSFVKDKYVDGEKWSKNDKTQMRRKTCGPFHSSQNSTLVFIPL